MHNDNPGLGPRVSIGSTPGSGEYEFSLRAGSSVSINGALLTAGKLTRLRAVENVSFALRGVQPTDRPPGRLRVALHPGETLLLNGGVMVALNSCSLVAHSLVRIAFGKQVLQPSERTTALLAFLYEIQSAATGREDETAAHLQQAHGLFSSDDGLLPEARPIMAILKRDGLREAHREACRTIRRFHQTGAGHSAAPMHHARPGAVLPPAKAA